MNNDKIINDYLDVCISLGLDNFDFVSFSKIKINVIDLTTTEDGLNNCYFFLKINQFELSKKEILINQMISAYSESELLNEFNWNWIDEFIIEHLEGLEEIMTKKTFFESLIKRNNKLQLDYIKAFVEIGTLLILNKSNLNAIEDEGKLYSYCDFLVSFISDLITFNLKEFYQDKANESIFSKEIKQELFIKILNQYIHPQKYNFKNSLILANQSYLKYLLQFSNCNELKWVQPFNNITEILSNIPDIWPKEFKYHLSGFSFTSTYFEVWENKEKIIEGKQKVEMVAINFLDKVEVSIRGISEEIILSSFSFYHLKPAYDRLLFVNIPISDTNDIGILNRNELSYKAGPEFLLEDNQPFASSLFYSSNKLVKVTFSLNEPARLIEFYL